MIINIIFEFYFITVFNETIVFNVCKKYIVLNILDYFT